MFRDISFHDEIGLVDTRDPSISLTCSRDTELQSGLNYQGSCQLLVGACCVALGTSWTELAGIQACGGVDSRRCGENGK